MPLQHFLPLDAVPGVILFWVGVDALPAFYAGIARWSFCFVRADGS